MDRRYPDPTACVCYTSDVSYLFPTVLSAIQARQQVSRETADILIYAFGIDDAADRAFRPACEASGVQLVRCERSAIDGAPVMLGRLFLSTLLPPQYRVFLYVDGDSLITDSLEPLFAIEIPKGKFLAVNDSMTFVAAGSGRSGRMIREHFTSIGMSSDAGALYFNSGVLLADRDGWSQIGMLAWKRFCANGKASRFADQDVLNVVGGPHHLPLSLAWNFPIFMMNAGVEADIAPRIYHFMSKPKPWEGVFPPWTRSAQAPYDAIVQRFPDLHPYRGSMGPGTRLRYHLQQRYKKVLETLTWSRSARRQHILDYERLAAAALPLRDPEIIAQAHKVPA
ncbi:MAG: glycosyltransferase family 8 protein [Janthinobacterium lividum]